MCGEIRSGRCGRLFLDSAKQLVAGWLIRRHSRVAARPAAPKDRLTHAQLRLLRELLEARFERPPDVGELAAAVGVGPHRLRPLLKASAELGPHAYLTHLRMERAKELLKDPQRALSDIAAELGFASQSHFGAVFRRELQTTPLAYRKQMLGR